MNLDHTALKYKKIYTHDLKNEPIEHYFSSAKGVKNEGQKRPPK